MFASEGDLHLELPSGERESSLDIWVRWLFWHEQNHSLLIGLS